VKAAGARDLILEILGFVVPGIEALRDVAEE
jgi:hypothetical protein